MWRRREHPEPEPPEEQVAPPDPAPRPPTVTEDAPPPADPAPPPAQTDDPYAQLENFFTEPIVLEDPAPQVPPSPTAPAPEPQAQSRSESPAAQASVVSEAIGRLEQFAQRLATRFEALEGQVQEGSAQTLESLRRLGERMGAELAMLDKRAVNLELTMARLRSTTEALESSLRKLPDMSGKEGTPSDASSADVAIAAPVPPIAIPAAESPPDAGGGLFTLEDEAPPSEWDEPPEDTPPSEPTWP